MAPIEDFDGKVAVITGGASGIGRGIARALAAEGAHVAVADIDGEAATRTADELGGRALAFQLDVRDRAGVTALADTVESELGPVDVLCNNAGVFIAGPMADVTVDDWEFVLSVNLDGVFHVGQTFSARMREAGRPGHVVNTASIGGFLSTGVCLAYTVSKYGVVAYSEALRSDLAPHGIGVSTLCPGPIDTGLPSSDKLRADHEQRGGSSSMLADILTDPLDPDRVGPIVLDGIRRNAPYIFTHDTRAAFEQRFAAVLAEFDHVPKDITTSLL